MKNGKMSVVLLIIVAFLMAGCEYGSTDFVSLDPGKSEIYTEAEIREAMDLVLKQFGKGFGGCVMLKLWYDEEASLKEAGEWAEQYDGEEAIVLYSNYWVDGSGRSPSLNPSSLYENWSWILVRSGGTWEVKDWGY